jgi:hypothetical protein
VVRLKPEATMGFGASAEAGGHEWVSVAEATNGVFC